MGFPFTIVGVTDTWSPLPRYYKLIGGSRFGTPEEFFIPFSSAIRHETQHNGSMSCNANRDPGYASLLLGMHLDPVLVRDPLGRRPRRAADLYGQLRHPNSASWAA
jgi:hypothetical protein